MRPLISNFGVGVLILFVNGNLCGNCFVWRSEYGEFFQVGMRENPPKEVCDIRGRELETTSKNALA
jgi:hypothetical protein